MNIKELRKASGMTQQAFSDYFGIPKRTIEDWEAGKRKCNKYLLDLIEYKLRNENIINTNQKKKGFEQNDNSKMDQCIKLFPHRTL